MKPALKKTFSAILIALASLVIVIGITSLAMVQGGKKLIVVKADTATFTLAPTELPADVSVVSTPVPEITSVQTHQTPSPTCDIPKDWMPIIVMPGQILEDIASQYKTTVEALMEGNCLEGTTVQEQTIIFVPFPTTAQTVLNTAQCGAPAGWVYYYVQPGDTLNRIAAAFGISVNQLMYANCLNSSNIYVGQALYVPNVPPYSVYPIQPIFVPTPTPWVTIPDLLTPEVPYLPTGIPFPPP